MLKDTIKFIINILKIDAIYNLMGDYVFSVTLTT